MSGISSGADNVAAVIFDMDGTLIDTEKLNVRFWKEAGRSFGHEVTDEDVLFIRSLDGKLVRRYLEDRFPGFDFDTVREKRRELMNSYVDEHGVQLKPGVKDILEFLKSKGVKTAVATASRRDHAERYLKMTGIFDYFTDIVYTSSVEHGKPSPDVYLLACDSIGERPEDCIAVEDSPNGIRSAHSAGCRTVFIPDLTGADEEIRSKSMVFEDMYGLKEFLSGGLNRWHFRLLSDS